MGLGFRDPGIPPTPEAVLVGVIDIVGVSELVYPEVGEGEEEGELVAELDGDPETVGVTLGVSDCEAPDERDAEDVGE